jgi:hypothetical protein
VSGIYVNFSDDEAASESRDVEPLPSGKYLCVVDDCQLAECGPESNNPGKPYYKFQFKVVEDKRGGVYAGRYCWANAMLFSPALFTITHIMKACGLTVTAGRMMVPEADFFVGKIMVVGGILMGESTDKRDPSKKYPPKFEPKSYFAQAQWSQVGAPAATGKATAKGATSLLS